MICRFNIIKDFLPDKRSMLHMERFLLELTQKNLFKNDILILG